MADYRTWLNEFSDWLKDVKDNEVKDLVEKFVESEQALKDLGKDKLAQYKLYLKRDIEHLKEHDQHYNDLAWQELKESLWYELSHIEDKSQLEWRALNQDFAHQGVYHVGEWVAMGSLVCQHCHHTIDIYHATQITPCTQCDGTTFTRHALQP